MFETRLAGVALLALAAACSSSNSAGPAADSGVAADAATQGNDWSCIGHVTLSPPAKTTLMWKLWPSDMIGNDMFPDLPVQVCGANDAKCVSPVAMGTTDPTTGYATLSVPAGQNGFDGFWQSQPTGAHTTLNFSNIPIRNDVQIDQRQEWDANAIRNALGPAGVQWDTTKAIVLFRVQDCNSGHLHQDTVPTVPQSTAALGTGVSVTIAPSASGIVSGYFQGGMLATTTKQTDASGQGGFVDVPEGSVTLTAKVVATGQTIVTAQVYARAGSVTDTVLAPSP